MDLPKPHQLHFWFTTLDNDLYWDQNIHLLSEEEIKKTNQFKFELDRKRYIIAHTTFRSILSLYLNLEPIKIQILRLSKGKPWIKNTKLEFNLSHSHNLAIYAFTQNITIGVDIEKMESHYNDPVAKRFFSTEEYEQFSKLTLEQRTVEFYKIWTGKEALVKALGEGIGFSLSSFTVPTHGQAKEIILKHLVPPQIWYLENLELFPEYQISWVTAQKITQYRCFEWINQEKSTWQEVYLPNGKNE